MLVIIILLLVAVVAIMLFGRAAILAAAVAVLGYIALVIVGSVFAITMSEMLGSETILYVAGTIAFVLILFALWDEAEKKERKAEFDRLVRPTSFNSTPPSAERRAELKQTTRQSKAADQIDRYLSEIDVASDNPADYKPPIPVQKDRLVGRIGGERLKSLHRVSMKDLVSRLSPEGKDVEGSGD